MLRQINEDTTIATSLAERKVIHAEDTWRAHQGSGRAPNQPQKGISAGGERQLARRARPGPPAQGKAKHLKRSGQADGALGTYREEIWQPLRERALGTGGDITKEPSDMEEQAHWRRADGQIAWAPRVGAMEASGRGGTLRASSFRAGRMRLNNEDGSSGFHPVDRKAGKLE